ncbi:MAG: electron transfer flavoprotein subunit alpha, partial [Elusimicrobia bacterium]|nr:electron transfer flavoprotein subunit alpha [Elusimicrobiota bacterium]
MIEISAKCIGCSKCVKACPFGALSMEGKTVRVRSACTLCGACVQVCPVQAISISRKEESRDLSGHKGVWVFVELQDAPGGKKAVRGVGHELLSCGRGLAYELGEELCAVLIGDGVAGLADELASYGADRVYLVENPALRDYNTDLFSTVMVALITKHKPSSVLYPSTYIGRDLAPRIASELYVGLTADCTGLSIKNGNLLQTRPAFGGNIMADIVSPNTRPQIATVRPNVMKKRVPAKGAKAQVSRENIAVDPGMARVKVVEKHVAQSHGGMKLDEAEVVISGGRGMRDAKGFKLLEQLAEALGGTVGASRAAVDMGLKPKPHQVGQSGTTVSPKLYVACGISGAVQHIVGMSSSDVIIAVNRDPSAQIFGVCKYGLVGDAHQVVAKVLESIK